MTCRGSCATRCRPRCGHEARTAMVLARSDRQLLAVRLNRDAERAGLEVAPGLPVPAHARATMAAGSIHVPVAAVAKLEAAQADHRRDDGRHSQAGARLAAKCEAGRVQLAS